jgi:hypothetical protein
MLAPVVKKDANLVFDIGTAKVFAKVPKKTICLNAQKKFLDTTLTLEILPISPTPNWQKIKK